MQSSSDLQLVKQQLLNAIKAGDLSFISNYCDDGQNVAKLIEVLTIARDDTDKKNPNLKGRSAIRVAAKNSHAELVRFLIENALGFPETKALLAEQLVELNQEDKNLLHEAATIPGNEANIELLCGAAKKLCDLGVKAATNELTQFVNLQDELHGSTALHFSARRCCFSNYLALIAAGADSNVKSKNGMVALELVQFADPTIALPFMFNYVTQTKAGMRDFFQRHGCKCTDIETETLKRMISIELDIMLKDSPAAQRQGYRETMVLVCGNNDMLVTACIPNLGYINYSCITEQMLQQEQSGSGQILAAALRKAADITSPDLKNLFIRAEILWNLKHNPRATKEAFDCYGAGKLLEQYPKLALQGLLSLDASSLNKDTLVKRIIAACVYSQLNDLRQTDTSGVLNLFSRKADKLENIRAVLNKFSEDLRQVISIDEMLQLTARLPGELNHLKEMIHHELRNAHLLPALQSAVKKVGK